MKAKPQHLHSGLELSTTKITQLITLACEMKQNRNTLSTALQGKHLALIFDKPSLRTRFSFTIAMRELGGSIVETLDATRKQETCEDLMRVVQGYCHALMIRTFDDTILERMQILAEIPVINGLTDLYHPCQILADLMTLIEVFKKPEALTLCYIGDGNNILHSLLLMAPKLGIHIHYCCPEGFGPNAMILKTALSNAKAGMITAFQQPTEAAQKCHAIYTDVWESMGYEPRDETHFSGYQVNEALMQQADKNAVFMHCMPMVRGKEVSETLPDSTCSVVFQQSENRLHIQKALLYTLLN